MGVLSFLQKEKTQKCTWCRREMDNLPYTKKSNDKEYRFCSTACKKAFRVQQNNKGKNTCPTCMLTGR